MYRIVKNIMSEDDMFEIEIKDGFLNDKSTWWELNIDFITIIWQQEIKTTATRVNKLSTDIEKNVSNLKNCSFKQQQ